jgi:hypothetical protein
MSATTITKSESNAIINLILAANAPKAVSPRMARRAARIERKSLNSQICEWILSISAVEATAASAA